MSKLIQFFVLFSVLIVVPVYTQSEDIPASTEESATALPGVTIILIKRVVYRTQMLMTSVKLFRRIFNLQTEDLPVYRQELTFCDRHISIPLRC